MSADPVNSDRYYYSLPQKTAYLLRIERRDAL